jgi:hypothetical protein
MIRLKGLSELAGGRKAAARYIHEVVTYGISLFFISIDIKVLFD